MEYHDANTGDTVTLPLYDGDVVKLGPATGMVLTGPDKGELIQVRPSQKVTSIERTGEVK